MKLKNPSSGKHIINHYFEHIYVVNLKSAVEDRLKVTRHLNRHNIDFELFEATNGYEGKVFEHYQKYKKRALGDLKRYAQYSEREQARNKPFIDSAGVMGYIYTYLNILKDAKAKGYRRFLILEDDILLSKDFEKQFKHFIGNIDNDWKILLLGASQYGWDRIDTKTAERNKFYFPTYKDEFDFTYGSFAMGLDLSIVNELIEAESAFESPFDYLPMEELYRKYNGKCFIAYPNIIIPDVSTSSIRQANSQKIFAQRRKWIMEMFDYPLDKPSISILLNSPQGFDNFTNFRDSSTLPFDPRLFFHTTDGLHPLHSGDLFDTVQMTTPADDCSFACEADYMVQIGDNEVLTQKYIVHFLEYKLGIAETHTTPLKEVPTQQSKCPSIVSDRVSVIVAVCEESAYLEKTLTSVFDQEYGDVEMVLVMDRFMDSATNTKTKKIFSTLQKQHPEHTVVLLECEANKNSAIARNYGLLRSSGAYISFIDVGDVFLPKRLSKSIAALQAVDKSIGGVYCAFSDQKTSTNSSVYAQNGDLSLAILLQFGFEKRFLYSSTVTYKRETLLRLNGYDESYARLQDIELHLRFFKHFTMKYLDETLVRLDMDRRNTDLMTTKDEFGNTKRKFIHQYHATMLQVIEKQKALSTQYEEKLAHVERQAAWIRKQEQFIQKYTILKHAISDLASISLIKHPVKKAKQYKKLMKLFYGKKG